MAEPILSDNMERAPTELNISITSVDSHQLRMKVFPLSLADDAKEWWIAEWDAEEERKRFEELKKTKPKTTLRKPTSLAQERNQMMNFLKGQGYKNLQKLKYPQMKELAPVIDSPDGEYLIIHRANNHFRAFDTLWEILHILDRQDLYHLYRVVQDYYEHIPPTGLGLILLGDLTIIWETAESG
ncbi:hypothetical protein Tco_0010443 [Tanacetum coccineum]